MHELRHKMMPLTYIAKAKHSNGLIHHTNCVCMFRGDNETGRGKISVAPGVPPGILKWKFHPLCLLQDSTGRSIREMDGDSISLGSSSIIWSGVSPACTGSEMNQCFRWDNGT